MDDPWDDYTSLVRTVERTQRELAEQRRQAIDAARDRLEDRRAEIDRLRQRLDAVQRRVDVIYRDGRSLAAANGAVVPISAASPAPALTDGLDSVVRECEVDLRYAEQLLNEARSATVGAEKANRERMIDARRIQLDAERTVEMKELAIAVAVGVGAFLGLALFARWGVFPAPLAVALSSACLVGMTEWVRTRNARAALHVAAFWPSAYDPAEPDEDVPFAMQRMIWVGAGGVAILLCVVGAVVGTPYYVVPAIGLSGVAMWRRSIVVEWYDACQDLWLASRQEQEDD